MTRTNVTQEQLALLIEGPQPSDAELTRAALIELNDLRWAILIIRALWLQGESPVLDLNKPAYQSVLDWWDGYKPTVEAKVKEWLERGKP